MKLFAKTLFILSALALSASLYAEPVVVIVNEANGQSLSADDIKGIYNDNVTQWSNGAGIKSFDLPTKNESREVFSQKILGTSAKDAAREWANRKITNTAKNPPKTKKEKLVVLSVSKNKDAIGYVSKSAADGKSGIKVIMTIE